MRRQHRHLRLGVERPARQALPDHELQPAPRAGSGQPGLRACNGYRYEFHIGKGTSLKDKVVYRVEFTNTLQPEARPSAADPLGGGNELLWQLTGGTETMKVTRVVRPDSRDEATTRCSDEPSGAAEQPRPADRSPGLRLGAFQGYDSATPTSREVGLYDQPFVDTFIQPLSNGGRIIAGQFDDPYQLDEKGIFDLVNLSRDDLGGIPGARRAAGGRVHRLQRVLDRPRSADADIFPERHPAQRHAAANSTDSLLRVWSRIMRQETQTSTSNIITGLKGRATGCRSGRNALPLFNAGLVGTQRQTPYLRSSPMHDVTNFGADILFPVLVRDAEALGIYAALGVPPHGADAQGPALDIINAINLGGRSRWPTASRATSSRSTRRSTRASPTAAPGRRTAPNRIQVNVNSVLISLIVAGNPAAGWPRASRSTTRTSSTASRSWPRRTRACSRDTAASTRRRCRTSRIPPPRNGRRLPVRDGARCAISTGSEFGRRLLQRRNTSRGHDAVLLAGAAGRTNRADDLSTDDQRNPAFHGHGALEREQAQTSPPAATPS
jgi:hypothetical protein